MVRIRITQILLILSILVITNFLGIVDEENMVIVGIPLHDMTSVILLAYLIVTFKEVRSRITPINRIVVAYLLLVTIIIISMPLRENETLGEAFLAGRRYYVMLIAFVVDDNIYYSGSKRFVVNLVYLLGLYYTILAIYNYIEPYAIQNYFPGLRNGVDDEKGSVLVRNAITDNAGILFVHFSFIYKSLSVICNSEQRRLSDFALVLVYFVGIFGVGLRAPIFSHLFSLFLVYILCSGMFAKAGLFSGIKQIKYIAVVLLVIICVNEVADNKILDFTESVTNDISGLSKTRENTYSGRIKRALVYQIPQAMEQPIFGVGFIYKNTPAAHEHRYNRLSPNRVRDLYNMDFGYGTLWVTFGLFGAFIIIYCFIRAIIEVIRQDTFFHSEDLLQIIVIFIAFLICNYTWAVLRDACGLIIIAFSSSIANEAYMRLQPKYN